MSNVRESRRIILMLQLLILLISVLWFAFPRKADAQAACSADYTSLSVLGVGKSSDAALFESVAGWQLDPDRYQDAIGRPIASIQLETDGTKEGRVYTLVYDSRANWDEVVVFTYSYERLFESRGELHNHPDCGGGTLARTDYDALIAALES